MYLLTAIGLPHGGSSTVHIYIKTIHRTTQLTNWEEGGPCPVFEWRLWHESNKPIQFRLKEVHNIFVHVDNL
jgi:hypothetical protein